MGEKGNWICWDWEQNSREAGSVSEDALHEGPLGSIGWLIMAALVLSSDDPLLEVSAMCPKPIDEEYLRSMGFPQIFF